MGAKQDREAKCADWSHERFLGTYKTMWNECDGHDLHGKPFPQPEMDMPLDELIPLWDRMYENMKLRACGFVPMPESKPPTTDDADADGPISVDMDMCYLTKPCQHDVTIGAKKITMSAPDIVKMLTERGLPIDPHFADYASV